MEFRKTIVDSYRDSKTNYNITRPLVFAKRKTAKKRRIMKTRRNASLTDIGFAKKAARVCSGGVPAAGKERGMQCVFPFLPRLQQPAKAGLYYVVFVDYPCPLTHRSKRHLTTRICV